MARGHDGINCTAEIQCETRRARDHSREQKSNIVEWRCNSLCAILQRLVARSGWLNAVTLCGTLLNRRSSPFFNTEELGWP